MKRHGRADMFSGWGFGTLDPRLRCRLGWLGIYVSENLTK